MTNIQPNTPILELIERPSQTEGAKKIIDQVRLKLHSAALAGQAAEVIKVCENSEIRESRTFSKEEVLELIVYLAMTQQLELADLKVSKIINDKQGTLLVLEVKSPNPGDDKGHQLINYTIKGRHERNECGTSSVDRSFWDEDDMPEPPYGDNSAEYLEGKWCFHA